MEPAPDLSTLVTESFAALSAGDRAFVEDHISRQPGTHALGTDAAEWWSDPDAIRQGAAEAAGLTFVAGPVQAWREGSVGWVVAPDARFQLPDGGEVRFRYTGVYHLEDGS